MSTGVKFSRKKFANVNIEISNICNLQCSFCPEVVRAKKLMDLSLFEKIIPQLAPITEHVSFHLMGDPLVHPKLEEFVAVCARENVLINIVSNGVLLREKQIEILLNPAIRQVSFSLHAYPDNFPNQDPTDHLNKIFAFTERAFVERPDLYVNFRLWNLQSASEKQSGPNAKMLALIEERFIWKFIEKSTNQTVNVREQKSIKIKNRLYLHFDTEFVWPSLDLPVIGTKGFCHGLSGHFGILAEGTVVPCCLDKEGKIPLGDANQEPLVSILENEKSLKILKGFRERKLTEELCKRCNYIERFN